MVISLLKQQDSPRRSGGGIAKQNPETNTEYGALVFCSKAEHSLQLCYYFAQVGHSQEYIHIG